MNKKETKKFEDILLKRKLDLIAQATSTREDGMALDPNDLPDEVDLASSEADQSMNLLLRDRERVLLQKIEKALVKIKEGTYGTCESCGDKISAKRLEARPVTDLCIRCKEEQETVERSYAE